MKLISLQRQRTDARDFIGIVFAKDWFKYWPEKDTPYKPLDFVIGRWREINDTIGNMVFFAVCRSLDDAIILYDKHKLNYQDLKPLEPTDNNESMGGIPIKINMPQPSKKIE